MRNYALWKEVPLPEYIGVILLPVLILLAFWGNKRLAAKRGQAYAKRVTNIISAGLAGAMVLVLCLDIRLPFHSAGGLISPSRGTAFLILLDVVFARCAAIAGRARA